MNPSTGTAENQWRHLNTSDLKGRKLRIYPDLFRLMKNDRPVNVAYLWTFERVQATLSDLLIPSAWGLSTRCFIH